MAHVVDDDDEQARKQPPIGPKAPGRSRSVQSFKLRLPLVSRLCGSFGVVPNVDGAPVSDRTIPSSSQGALPHPQHAPGPLPPPTLAIHARPPRSTSPSPVLRSLLSPNLSFLEVPTRSHLLFSSLPLFFAVQGWPLVCTLPLWSLEEVPFFFCLAAFIPSDIHSLLPRRWRY